MILVDYPGHFVAGLLLAGVAVSITFAFRSGELRKAKLRHHRLLLMLLQYTAVIVLLLVAWNPSRSKESEIFSRDSVLALFDTSQSMSVAEHVQRTRLDSAITVFKERFRPSEELRSAGTDSQGPQYRIFGFDRRTYYSGSVGLLRRWGSQTDLHSAFALLHKYKDEKTDANGVTGAVILTDGQAADKNIETYLPIGRRDFQIVLVGVGSRQPQRDIAIKSITAPSRVAIDTAYSVQVAVTARGLRNPVSRQAKDEPVTVELLKDDHVIDSNQFSFDKLLPGEAMIEFRVGADTIGSHTLSARAQPLEKEVNLANNLRSTVVQVAQQHKLRVLFYSQVANFNVGKIRQALARDDKIQLDLGLDAIKNPALSEDAMQTCGYTKLPGRREEFYKYDLIILGPCESGNLTDAQLDDLYSFVVDRGGGLILLPTRAESTPGIWTNQKIRSLMPTIVDLTKPLSQTDNSGHIELTFEGTDSRIIGQADLTNQDAPIWAYYRITDTKPAASTLATVRNTPVICVHRVGRGRVCLLNISQLFPLYRQDRDCGLLAKLLSGLTSYVGRVANLEAGVELFAQRVGEEADKIGFTAYVCDKSFAPVSGANVLLNTRGQALSMNQISPGYYAAEIENAEDETIVATAQAEINGTFLGEKTIAANLPAVHTEMADTELDEEFLRALAKRLNGRYIHAEDLTEDSARMFKAQVQTGRQTVMTSIWPTWLLLLTLCLLLSINWYLRRAIGLV